MPRPSDAELLNELAKWSLSGSALRRAFEIGSGRAVLALPSADRHELQKSELVWDTCSRRDLLQDAYARGLRHRKPIPATPAKDTPVPDLTQPIPQPRTPKAPAPPIPPNDSAALARLRNAVYEGRTGEELLAEAYELGRTAAAREADFKIRRAARLDDLRRALDAVCKEFAVRLSDGGNHFAISVIEVNDTGNPEDAGLDVSLEYEQP